MFGAGCCSNTTCVVEAVTGFFWLFPADLLPLCTQRNIKPKRKSNRKGKGTRRLQDLVPILFPGAPSKFRLFDGVGSGLAGFRMWGSHIPWEPVSWPSQATFILIVSTVHPGMAPRQEQGGDSVVLGLLSSDAPSDLPKAESIAAHDLHENPAKWVVVVDGDGRGLREASTKTTNVKLKIQCGRSGTARARGRTKLGKQSCHETRTDQDVSRI